MHVGSIGVSGPGDIQKLVDEEAFALEVVVLRKNLVPLLSRETLVQEWVWVMADVLQEKLCVELANVMADKQGLIINGEHYPYKEVSRIDYQSNKPMGDFFD